ncbi:uncharacterized protein BDR25DRAFT_65735 [Lindgomyces ingoldianus]|uniref:Uncharacterized protein n=1 Tax=Lindgomyces ingoldianus TaxID=673940 RepID=A0ACB6RAR0_9PLEO|nr:uncharacterized protein BDR25DRAFT_65735 [Lindgomyces ingoldianus]KAF2476403.1 hypothetical protein BDR25DRAFT_65735 [Lindgomyces ingoldianus]
MPKDRVWLFLKLEREAPWGSGHCGEMYMRCHQAFCASTVHSRYLVEDEVDFIIRSSLGGIRLDTLIDVHFPMDTAIGSLIVVSLPCSFNLGCLRTRLQHLTTAWYESQMCCTSRSPPPREELSQLFFWFQGRLSDILALAFQVQGCHAPDSPKPIGP